MSSTAGAGVGAGTESGPASAPRPGLLRTPGLVDQHCHGALGVDFATAPADDVRQVVRELTGRGIARVVASLPTLPAAETLASVRRLSPLVHEGTLAGLHLEGPFLARARCGAHPIEHLREPTDPAALSWLDGVLDAGRRGSDQAVVALTYAPELEGVEDLESLLAAHGVLPSPGHTDATATQIRAALERLVARTGTTETGGAPAVTHLFNAMRGFHHRGPGPVPTLLREAAAGRLRLELIADGQHVDPEVVRDVLALAPDAVCVVSDASAATGAAPGRHRLGAVIVEAPAGAPRAAPRLAGGTTLASGAVTLDGALHNLLDWGVTLPVALAATSTTPARGLPAQRRHPGWVDWVTDPETGMPTRGRPAGVVPAGTRP